MRDIDRLVKIADFLDREGLVTEADYVDSLIKNAQEPAITKPEANEIEQVENSESQDDVNEMVRIKQRFIDGFYRKLTELHKRFRETLNEENFGYLGEDRRQVIKISFDALIDAIEDEFRSFKSQTASFRFAKKVDNSKVLKDVIKNFTPILNMYEHFTSFVAAYPEFAKNFPRTQATFLNLRNVVNNIIKSVPEEILDIDLTRK